MQLSACIVRLLKRGQKLSMNQEIYLCSFIRHILYYLMDKFVFLQKIFYAQKL